MIIAYHHTQITAPKGAEADVRRFYRDVLGLKETPLPEALRDRNLIWFEVGASTLHVGFEDGVNRAATNAHLAYEVDDIAAFRRRVKDAGYELIEQPKIAGYDRFHTHDPFGNRLEIIGRNDVARATSP
ncbi:MAG TPA: VOC family protein [Tepidisphaeraceae bacterium]|nr:VOC family protein [Tepidisphaeraceae bacterium]